VKGRQTHFILTVQRKFILSEGARGLFLNRCIQGWTLVTTFIFPLMLFVWFMHLAGLIQAAVRTCCGPRLSAPGVTCACVRACRCVWKPNYVGVGWKF